MERASQASAKPSTTAPPTLSPSPANHSQDGMTAPLAISTSADAATRRISGSPGVGKSQPGKVSVEVGLAGRAMCEVVRAGRAADLSVRRYRLPACGPIDPDGIRTRVAALKGPCPGPLDDGACA